MTNVAAAGGKGRPPKKFKPTPFAYHEEVELEITTLTNLGEGLGRINGWVVMVPFVLPGERVLARVWHNAANFSRADCVRVLSEAAGRVTPRCPLAGVCGGCQYQHFNYAGQLEWKARIVGELLQRLGGAGLAGARVNACVGSPREFGYRSKITPHFEVPARGAVAGAGADAGAEANFPIGFLSVDQRQRLVDVPACPIATDAINAALPGIREGVRARRGQFKRGATLLIRDTAEGVVTDFRATATERVDLGAGRVLTLSFPAGDFFQNNPFILPAFVNYVLKQARGGGSRFLLDAYCGSGLFALAGAADFERVLGVEVNPEAVANATLNAAANGIANCRFVAGKAEQIFADADLPPAKTTVLMDPPRRGSDGEFLAQLTAFAPNRVVYVSCAPDTQARDLAALLAAGYAVEDVQPFDLFPQTRHIENVVTLRRI